MASLRRRVSKREAATTLAWTASDSERSSAGSASSNEDTTAEKTQRSKSEPGPVRYENSTPPPISSFSFLSDPSPPQSVLDRYKRRAASLPHTTVTLPVKSGPLQRQGSSKSVTFTEDLDQSEPPAASSRNTACRRRQEFDDEIRHFKGVNFEMLGTRSKVGQAPQPAAPEPRQTRSQTRRQQRIDSFSAATALAVARKLSNASEAVSVQGDEVTMSGALLCDDSPTPSSTSPLGLPSELDAFIADFNLATPTDTSAELDPRASPTSPRTVENEEEAGDTPLIEPDASPLPLGLPYRPKPLNAKHKRHNCLSSTPVNPPIPNPMVRPEDVWLSPLPSSSRPIAHWHTGKRWECCQCGPLGEKGKAARTIVEQRICSRLVCGHEFCLGGCTLLPDLGFNPYFGT